MSSEKDIEYIVNNMEFLASMYDLELTDNALKIAKAKLMFFGKDNWHKCCCVRDDKHFCISPSCLEEIDSKGICDCRLYKKKEQQ